MQGLAMDYALATDGYYFSSEAFQSQPQIEAIQLACLLGINADTQAEIILDARSLHDDIHFQLALTGQLQVLDPDQHPVSSERLQQMPLQQLQEQELTKRGWTISQRPCFSWLKQQQPLRYQSTNIQTCAINQLQSLRSLLQYSTTNPINPS